MSNDQKRRKRVYVVYDSRAAYDVDEAAVFECLGPMAQGKARREFNRRWREIDAVLVSYADENGELTDERIEEY